MTHVPFSLIETITNIHGFPPCLVSERGRYTLSERRGRNLSDMEQRAILNSVGH